MTTIQKIRTYILTRWISTVFFLLMCLFYIMLPCDVNKILLRISDFLFLSSLILLLITSIRQLIKGKWYWGILQLIALFVGLVMVMFMMALWLHINPNCFPNDPELFQNTIFQNVEFEDFEKIKSPY